MKLFIILISIISVSNSCHGYRFSALEFYAHILNGDFLDYKPFGSSSSKGEENQQTAVSVGQSPNSFLDFITYKDKKQCTIYEEQATEVDDAKVSDGKRGPLKVKCIPAKGNGTLHIITSLKEAISVLAPDGNSTKRSHAGSCVVMLFYTTTCIHSAMMAPHYNALARFFPDLKVAAIDALSFSSLNTEFGIVGLPTILFFHQGRPLVKFNDTSVTLDTLVKFVTKHSGVQPRLDDVREPHYISEDFKGPLSNKVEIKTDYWLCVAWIFIIVCSGYYFSKSVLYVQMIEMVKRNWRESEAHHRS